MPVVLFYLVFLISLMHNSLHVMQRHIYRYEGKNIQVFADDSSLAVNPTYIRSWLDLLSRTPRVAPFLSKDDPFISALKKVLYQKKVVPVDTIYFHLASYNMFTPRLIGILIEKK